MELSIQDQLRRPFALTKIHWRVGNTNAKKLGVKPWEATEGSALAYIDARDVMTRLDSVVGIENWQCDYPISDSGLLICRVGIRCSIFGLDRNEWIWKANGAGDTQVEAEKGKCSDAMKRAAVLWGIGQYLYSLPFSWVPLKNGRIKDTEFLSEQLPKWASPEGFDEIIAKRSKK